MQDVILSVQDLEVEFTLRGKTLHAIRGISLDICEGESLAIVGESGSGKSVFCKTFMGLLDSNGRVTRGSIRYGEKDLAAFKTEKEWLSVRGKEIAMVMQDPMTSLNPLKTVGAQICEALTLHQGMKGEAAKQKATEILEDVGITEAARRFGQYPHEFSGGMRQRVVIAIAIACNPRILICDEPTTALDVTIQAQIIELMQEMQEKNGNAIIMITHDLGVVADMADKIMVMYAGRPVEFGTAEEIFYESRHPYTWGLIRSIPEQAIDEKKPLTPIHGNPPSLMNLPEGCVFSPRCPYATDKCRKQRPERVVTESGHYSACHYSGDPEFLKNAPETSRTRKDSKKGGEA